MTDTDAGAETTLARALLAALPSEAAGTPPAEAELEPLLLALVKRARAAWPDFMISDRAFVAHVATRLGPQRSLQEALAALSVEDLFLAFACASGDAAALGAFERTYGRDLALTLSRLDLDEESTRDVRQALWQKLFVGADGRPAIAKYSGRGQLRYWLRVTALRNALDEIRTDAAPPARSLDDLLEIPSAQADPELEHMKRLYRHEFADAFEEAAGALDAAARNALRSYYAYGMSIDEIAAASGIHRATAARHVTRAREALLNDTRARLMARLAVDPRELDSVMRLIASRLDLSIRRMLG